MQEVVRHNSIRRGSPVLRVLEIECTKSDEVLLCGRA